METCPTRAPVIGSYTHSTDTLSYSTDNDGLGQDESDSTQGLSLLQILPFWKKQNKNLHHASLKDNRGNAKHDLQVAPLMEQASLESLPSLTS